MVALLQKIVRKPSLSCKTSCANPLQGQGLGFATAVAGPNNDNNDNDDDDDDNVGSSVLHIVVASTISPILATLLLR